MKCKLCAVPRWALTALGLFAISLSVAATAIGFDKNPNWGPRRIGLLLVGAVTLTMVNLGAIDAAGRWFASKLMLTAIASRIPAIGRKLQRGGGGLAGIAGRDPGTEGTDASQAPSLPHFADVVRVGAHTWGEAGSAREVRTFGPVVVLMGITVALYVWFISVGTWTEWSQRTAYYDALAQAFASGQTSLLIEPDARLAELDDPLSASQRGDISFLWDASYFEGKYYLYFGPTPGALLAIVKLFWAGEVADLYIVFLAVVAILAFSASILLSVWRHYFAERLPYWVLLASVGFVGVALPQLWVLGSRRIHEAAVSSGAAFLLGAFYAGLPFLYSGKGRSQRLVVTGSLLALAVGARPSLLFPAAILTALIIYRLARQGDGLGTLGARLLCLLLPLFLGGVLIGWYNYDRFRDVFETGYRYQLTRREGSWQSVFDARYLLPNLYNYLLNSYRTLPIFPYLKPKLGVESVPYIGVVYPHMYRPEIITGIALVAPAHVFAVLLGWWVVCGGASSKSRSKSTDLPDAGDNALRQVRWIATASILVALSGALPIGTYYWAANRFMLDFLPLLAIASCLGAWVAIDRYQGGMLERGAVPAFGLALFIASMIMAFLVGISGDRLVFENGNPVLFQWLTRALTW